MELDSPTRPLSPRPNLLLHTVDFPAPTGPCRVDTTPDLFPLLPEPQRSLWHSIAKEATELEAAIALRMTRVNTEKGVTELMFSPTITKLVDMVEGTFRPGNKPYSNGGSEQESMNILPHERLQSSSPRVYKFNPSGEELTYGQEYLFPVVYEFIISPLNLGSHTYGQDDTCTMRLAPMKKAIYTDATGRSITSIEGMRRNDAQTALSQMRKWHNPADVLDILEGATYENPYIEIVYEPQGKPCAAYRMELDEKGNIVCSLSLETKAINKDGNQEQDRVVKATSVIPPKLFRSGEADHQKHFATLIFELLKHLRNNNGKSLQ
jgi:hypothetical protein